jgi:nucleotide-binding universal stress UspA family protein
LRRFDSFSDVIGDIAAREARTADVFVATRPSDPSDEPEQLIETVLFETGRHLILVPKLSSQVSIFGHVMVAWNASREATRAVAEALPYLRKAELVSIVIVDEGRPAEENATLGPDLLAHLLHHGIDAAIHHVPLEREVGQTLIAESQQLKPDMIVMGGYGHSKLREWLLGGATYRLVHNSPVPLLLAH